MATKPPPPEPECRVAAQAVCRGEQRSQVLAVGAAASRNGSAHIAVRVGRVLVYIEDREALTCFVEAWQRAAELAENVFPPVTDVFELAERRARWEFEKGRRGTP